MLFGDDHTTWRRDTKLTQKNIFTLWYEELQKTKAYMNKLVSDEGLVVEEFDKDLFGVTERVRIITGESLYGCDADVDFVKEFKEQVTILLPLAGMYLFIEKYNKPLENLKTLRCFQEMSKTFSDLFDVAMTERYSEFLKSFEQEIKLINQSISVALDNLSGSLYTKNNERHLIGIKEDGFIFDTNGKSEIIADGIVERCKKETEKIRF